MAVYYSVSIKKQLVCNCSAYPFPHKPNYGNCSVIVPDSVHIPDRPSRSYIAYLVNNQGHLPV